MSKEIELEDIEEDSAEYTLFKKQLEQQKTMLILEKQEDLEFIPSQYKNNTSAIFYLNTYQTPNNKIKTNSSHSAYNYLFNLAYHLLFFTPNPSASSNKKADTSALFKRLKKLKIENLLPDKIFLYPSNHLTYAIHEKFNTINVIDIEKEENRQITANILYEKLLKQLLKLHKAYHTNNKPLEIVEPLENILSQSHHVKIFSGNDSEKLIILKKFSEEKTNFILKIMDDVIKKHENNKTTFCELFSRPRPSLTEDTQNNIKKLKHHILENTLDRLLESHQKQIKLDMTWLENKLAYFTEEDLKNSATILLKNPQKNLIIIEILSNHPLRKELQEKINNFIAVLKTETTPVANEFKFTK